MSSVGQPRKTQISYPESELDRLQAKLDDARLPEQEITSGLEPWEYGTELAKLKQVVNDWKTGSVKDSHNKPISSAGKGVKAWWRLMEAELNRFPHFLVEIEGITIHYQHFKPTSPSSKPAIPLIFSHGWPGSFTEGFHFGEKLVQSSDPAFEVIVPSLPGYGLSSQPPRKGWTLQDTARVFDTLMTSVLGHKSYMAQGGDWGSLVTRFLANHPACKIYHVNFLPPRPPVWAIPAVALEALGFKGIATKSLGYIGYDDFDIRGIKRGMEYIDQGSGYTSIQGTQPSTLGYGMYDDPVGILSWIMEKFHAWSDPRAPAFSEPGKSEPRSLVSDQNVLVNIMIYYLTNTIHTSFLPYKESMQFFKKPNLALWKASRRKPFGYTHFAFELAAAPKSWIAQYNLDPVFFKRHDRGGHFAALDNPEALAQDMVDFASQYWPKA